MEILFPFLLVLAFYFLVLRPQQKRVRAHQALIDTLGVGDHIVTAGGLLGTIVGSTDDRFEVQLAPNVVVQVMKGAIARKAPAELAA
ncbi:MAG TPA: preprotein translocase subunit YajC [Acidimicrobiales bacterium]|nr:preprotein translocase subunit YajC [Acidimicrobiales bacterium]